MKTDLSILIPARNEMFLAKTIKDIFDNAEGDTEVIAVCDGNWPDPPIYDHERLHIIYHPTAIGQRAAVNEAAKMSRAKYLMKVDAHCSFDKGFDVKMLSVIQDDWTMAPLMRNLHAFNWVCENSHIRYQGPSGPCKECGAPTKMDVVWIGKTNPQSTSYCFDPEPHFQYFNDYKRRPGGRNDITESMSLQGSCFMMTRDKYFELNICDEHLGSWGSQGIEVAVKTWLSGGKVMVNHKTWYAHMFRTQGGDFGFPWPCSGRQVQDAKRKARDLFFNDKWEKQIYPLSWLVEKFWPVPGWKQEDLDKLKSTNFIAKDVVKDVLPVIQVKDMEEIKVKEEKKLTRGFVYYTNNLPDPRILKACQEQIKTISNGDQIVSVSLAPLDFGENIVMPLKRGYLTMFKQILAGVEASKADILFFIEHDVLYHPSHFNFVPTEKNVFYYDENRWFVDAESGRALFYHACSTSLLCAHRELLLEHYRTRVERVEREGFTMRLGFEPGNHPFPRGVDLYGRKTYFSEFPSIDIRHGRNITPSRWTKEEFRNKSNLYAWSEADEVPGWGVTKGRFNEIIKSVLKEA